MNCINNQKEISVGVDTGKFQLDIHIRPLDIYFTVNNDEKGIKEAIKKIKPHNPTRVVIEQEAKRLSEQFDDIFSQKTSYEILNQCLRRLAKLKEKLLLVLKRPDVPLHTNGSESDIRDYVKKRKVSGGTRSDLGQKCRDTFISLKNTCRKLNISFLEYLSDRHNEKKCHYCLR